MTNLQHICTERWLLLLHQNLWISWFWNGNQDTNTENGFIRGTILRDIKFGISHKVSLNFIQRLKRVALTKRQEWLMDDSITNTFVYMYPLQLLCLWYKYYLIEWQCYVTCTIETNFMNSLCMYGRMVRYAGIEIKHSDILKNQTTYL